MPLHTMRPTEKRTLVIAMCGARVGSTNLCSVLAKLGHFGEPVEALNGRGPNTPLTRGLATYGDANAYLQAMASQAAILCFKTAWIDWAPLAATAVTTFPNASYLYLDRFDTEAQAHSAARAIQTGIWHRKKGEAAPPAQVEIDQDILQRTRDQIELERLSWRNFFFENRITPALLSYEQASANMLEAVTQICALVNIEPPAVAPEGDLMVLRRA